MMHVFCLSRRHVLDALAAALILGPASEAQAQAVSTLKIATIGAGAEGGALGTIFAKLGHPVMFSSRHPEQLKDLVAAAGPNARAGSVADAVAFGDVVFLVVPYSAVEQIGRDYGKALAAKGVAFQRYAFFTQDDRGIWTAPEGTRVAWFHDLDLNLLSIVQPSS